MKLFKYAIGAFFGLAALSAAIGAVVTAFAPQPVPVAKVRVVDTFDATQKAFIANAQKQNAAREARELVNAARVVSLSKAMRDPSSFKVSAYWDFPERDVFCVQYRAKNGFGGTNVEYAIWAGSKAWVGGADKTAAQWNRHCVRGGK